MSLRSTTRPILRTILSKNKTSRRLASTLDSPPVVLRLPQIDNRISSALKVSALVLGTSLFVAYYYDSRSAIHQYVVPPLMRATLDPEVTHRLAVRVLGSGFAPRDRGENEDILKCTIWDLEMPSPIGLAAGFDKDGEAIDGLFGLGFDWVEIGSVTPKAQKGNPKPRVFTLPDDNAMINRYGFPSQGHSLVLARLRSRRNSPSESGQVLAVNLGKNKSSPPDSIDDYLLGVRRFGSLPDVKVLVINVSSPNTPGLRGLQNRGMLEELLEGVCKERDALDLRGPKPKIVLKIAPDLDELAIQDVAEAVRESGVDGVIVSNTTIQRPKLLSASSNEIGGLSGPPLHSLSLKALKTLRAHLPANIPIIGCGGISTGADALDFARAGATSVQLYTSFGYTGVGTARRIKDELASELSKLNTTWSKVVDESIKTHAWVRPRGQQALDAGEREIRAMLDGLGKQMAVGDDLAALEDRDPDSPKGVGSVRIGLGLKLDSATARLAEQAEAALAARPHDENNALEHDQRGSLADSTGPLEKRRT
ncbi:dihydroorotate dehydrogenase [Ceratobasidium sp. AG-Ba]|nr:dihydroorotate dehydrogenase [Ceratobasidium sp. AG-Ba]